LATGPGDGHGRYETILVEAPSMEHLLNAQIKIKEKYGKYFFSSFANEDETPYFIDTIWQALIDTNYPIERFKEKQDNIIWEKCSSISEAIKLSKTDEYGYDDISIELELVKDAFIWLLNAFDAEIVRLDADKDIPMICNWSYPGFETVGYGCF
jgi:hypothetical protein